MKKFLSLVLALIMAMSLVTISAGAADFTDADSIDYAEAVEVMTAVGVVDGYTDGSFGPDGYLTRGAAAKIICNMILGPTTASALVADAAPYTDVAADNVFAGYIAYCQKEGIISGYADGTFKPGNSLTGYAFMKMLLGALGYDAAIEGYTGNNWSINVAKQAIAIGLNKGLADDFNGVKTVTRQEALLYAFNAMKATMVKYPNNTTITVGDINVTTTANKEKVPASGADYGIGDGYQQFCEEYFGKLKAQPTEDTYGRPATKWFWKNKAIGTYAKAPTLVYTTNPTLYSVRKDLGLGNSDQPYFYSTIQYRYDDGAAFTAYGQTAQEGGASDIYMFESGDWLLKNTYKSTDTAASKKLGYLAYPNIGTTGNHPAGRGVYAEVFFDAEKSAAGNYSANKVVIIDEMVGKVNNVKKDDIGTYVTVNNAPSGAKFYTDEFKKGDYVLYTVGINAENIIASMELAETVTGTITWLTADDNSTYDLDFYCQIDGVAYYNHGDNWFNNYNVKVGDEVIAYLDSNGYIADMEITDSATAFDKLLTINVDASGNAMVNTDWTGNTQAEVVYGDGKSEIVTLYKGIGDAGEIYNFTSVGGKLKVLTTNGYTTETLGAITMTKNDVSVGGYAANANTGYVIIDNTAKTIKTYTGYKAAPATDAAVDNAIALVDEDGVIVLMYVWTANSNLKFQSNTYTYVIADYLYKYETMNADGEVITYVGMKTLDGNVINVDLAVYDEIKYLAGANDYAGVAVIENLVYNAETKFVEDFDWVSGVVSYVGGNGDDYELSFAKDVLSVKNLTSEAVTNSVCEDEAVVYVVAWNLDSFYETDLAELDGEYDAYTVIVDEYTSEVEAIIVREIEG